MSQIRKVFLLPVCTVAGEEVRLLVEKVKVKVADVMGRSSNVIPSSDKSSQIAI